MAKVHSRKKRRLGMRTHQNGKKVLKMMKLKKQKQQQQAKPAV